jgi:hypothetical protein
MIIEDRKVARRVVQEASARFTKVKPRQLPQLSTPPLIGQDPGPHFELSTGGSEAQASTRTDPSSSSNTSNYHLTTADHEALHDLGIIARVGIQRDVSQP